MIFSIKGVWAGVVALRRTENPFNLVRFQEIPQSVNSNLLWRNWLAQEAYTFKVIGSSPVLPTLKCQNGGIGRHEGLKVKSFIEVFTNRWNPVTQVNP